MNQHTRRTLSAPLLAAICGLLISMPVFAADSPLLIPGKQSLFQRVLAIPGAELLTEAGGTTGEAITPFTAYYVYARENRGGSNWLHVGTGRHGNPEGWIAEDQTIDWAQGLTVAFREAVDRDRALLFDGADGIRRLIEAEDMTAYEGYYRAAVAGEPTADSPVVAIQPAGKLDLREDFYLVPILQHEELFVGSEKARLLQVSSVPLDSAPVLEQEAETVSEAQIAGAEDTGKPAYSAGLVFAIDSTLSMGPYIDRTQQAVMKIYEALSEADLVGNVNFGLVAFRDSARAVPELGYLSRTFVDLEQGGDAEQFLSGVRDLSAAGVSSQDFIEDSNAGVYKALSEMSWDSHAARYLVLVTDAGPRTAGDPLSSTGLDAQALRQLARQKGVAIFVLHLLTDATSADHPAAAEHYRELARFPGIGSLYYAVPTGDITEFGQVLDTLSGQITMQVQMAAASQPLPAEPVAPAPAENPQLAELQTKVAKLGYALQMQYLRRNEGVAVPKVFNAWLLDRDIKDPEQKTLDVRVLLTRDQLSDLHDILQDVLTTAEEGLLSPQNFLNELKSLAATIARDPERLGSTTAVTAGAGNSLADLGFMREYIEDLPYSAEVMGISLDDWETWSARRQIEFLHRLEDKISYYQALHDHTDLWVSLDGGPVDGDSVFPVALEMLP